MGTLKSNPDINTRKEKHFIECNCRPYLRTVLPTIFGVLSTPADSASDTEILKKSAKKESITNVAILPLFTNKIANQLTYIKAQLWALSSHVAYLSSATEQAQHLRTY